MNELAKFLSGFFFAIIILNICILLGGWLPLRFMGIIFDSSSWTYSLMVFIFLTMVFSFLGWGKKAASSLFIIFLLCILGTTMYLFDGFDAKSKASLVENTEEYKVLEINPEDSSLSERKMFTLSIGNDKNDSGTSIVVDNDGNIISAGYFQGTIDLDPGTGVMERTSLGGSINESAVDIYLTKYTQEGRLIWGFSLGSVGADMVNSLKTDKEGNVYIAGYYGGQMDADPTSEEKLINSGTGRDGFLIKYNKDGKLMWAKSFGNTETIPFSVSDSRFEEGLGIDIDESNNVYLIGVFDGKIDLDDSDEGKFSDTLEADDRDTFIAKYDLQGNFIKAVAINGKGLSQGQGIRVDSNGNIYVAGFFDGKIKLEDTTLSSAGSFDCFLAKYNKDLSLIFAKRWGGSSSDKVSIGAIDINNDIYVSGEFGGTVYLGDYKITSKGGTDIFFAKFNNEGGVVFAKSIGGVLNDSANKIKLDNADNLLITGYFRDTVDFDATSGVYFLQPNSYGEASDVFVAKYSSKGEFVWARNFGGYVSSVDEIQSGNAIAVDSDNSPIITGKFYDQVDFNSTEDLNLKSVGRGDAFIVKYNQGGEIE
jgi:hypothetical protein